MKVYPQGAIVKTEKQTVKLEVVAKGLETPWGMAFLPDGRMLITEKPGPVWLVTQQGAKTPVANVTAVLHQGQGGMLGVFLSPSTATPSGLMML